MGRDIRDQLVSNLSAPHPKIPTTSCLPDTFSFMCSNKKATKESFENSLYVNMNVIISETFFRVCKVL